MKILIITASLPYPPASGGALRVYGLMQGLHAAGHTLTLFALHTGAVPVSPLTTLCDRIVTASPPSRSRITRLRDLVLSGQPDIAQRFYSVAAADKLRVLLREQSFDLIQVEAIEVACYIPVVRTTQPSAKLCFDTFNAEYVLQRVIAQIDRQDLARLPAALYSTLQARRIEPFEGAMCRAADVVVAVSPEDADALRPFRTDGQIVIVPSGISTAAYARPTDTQQDPYTLVFTGKMDYRPNVDAILWFANSILPIILSHVPQVKLMIVGQQPHARLDRLRANPAIALTGWVDSVQPYLHTTTVYIAPLRMGSGTRLKLLEAMAAGCAIVATTAAATGLLDNAKQAMRIADTPDVFAQRVVDLLQHPAERTALGFTAQHAVQTHYDWSVLIPRLLKAYEGIGLG